MCVCVCVCARACILTILCLCVLSHFGCIQLFATLYTAARQAPLSMGFSRPVYWNGLSWPPPGDLPDLEIKPASLTSSVLAGEFFTSSATWEAHCTCRLYNKHLFLLVFTQ